jgi:glycosyltransferase involved in cell wall biosynthesis
MAEEIHGVKFFKLPRIFGSQLDLLFHFFIMRYLVLKCKPDAVNSHYATGNALLGVFTGIRPLIISVWGSDIYLTPRRSIPHKMFIKFVLSRADAICSTSRIMKGEIEKYYPSSDKVHVVPFGVDPAVFHPTSKHGKHGIRIGTIKRMVDGKGYNHAELISIFSGLIREHPDMTLELVGSGPIKGKLQEYAEKIGLNGNIKFHGRRHHKDIPEILNSWDIYCCASTQENESFGVAVLEASACGLPIVAFNMGGLKEVVRDNVTGILIEPGDFHAFKNALKKIIMDKGIRSEMGRNGAAFVREKYNWKENGNAMLRVIDEAYARK